MKLGILGAMDCEIALLLDKMQRTSTETFAGIDYHTGKIGKMEVVVARCGIGKVNAALCTCALIQRYGATHIINTGVAGGVTPEAGVFDVILSTSVCYHDFTPGILAENFPYAEEYPADAQMIKTMRSVYEAGEHNFKFREQRIVTGDVFVDDDALKASIAKRFQPGCVDMESSAVGQTCYIMKTPFITLRSLSDTADNNAGMTFDQFAAIAANNSAGLILDFCDAWAE